VVVGVGILNNENEVGGGFVDENACDMSLVRLVVSCPVLRLVDLLNCRSIGWLCFRVMTSFSWSVGCASVDLLVDLIVYQLIFWLIG
jgi:hypothetical protein